MGKITRAQREALKRIYDRDPAVAPSYLAFRRTVKGPFYKSDPCVMVQWKGMFLGVESDGYTHS